MPRAVLVADTLARHDATTRLQLDHLVQQEEGGAVRKDALDRRLVERGGGGSLGHEAA